MHFVRVPTVRTLRVKTVRHLQHDQIRRQHGLSEKRLRDVHVYVLRTLEPHHRAESTEVGDVLHGAVHDHRVVVQVPGLRHVCRKWLRDDVMLPQAAESLGDAHFPPALYPGN